MGVPAGLRKSAPPCALRGWPLKMLRVPKALLAASATGRTNGSRHSRSGDDERHTSSSSFASRSIRSRSDSGGVTNAGSTVSVRVRKQPLVVSCFEHVMFVRVQLSVANTLAGFRLQSGMVWGLQPRLMLAGQMVKTGAVDDLVQGSRTQIVAEQVAPEGIEAIRRLSPELAHADGNLTAYQEDTGILNQILDLVRRHGGLVVAVVPQRRRPEDIFVETVGIEGRRIGSMAPSSPEESA